MIGQRRRQGEITDELEKEMKAYYNEMLKSAKTFGTNSNEYRAAQTQYQEISKAFTESKTAMVELTYAIDELKFTVQGYKIERLEKFVDKLGSITSLAEKRGTNRTLGFSVTEDLYTDQMKYNNDIIIEQYKVLQDRKDQIAKYQAGTLKIDSGQYEELYNQAVEAENTIISLTSANEDLIDSFRAFKWQEYKKFQETLTKISSDFDHIQGFIREGELLDDDGQFTARGFAQMALIGEQMDVAEKKIANARAAIEKLDEELALGVISEEEYGSEFEEQMGIIQNAASDAYDKMQKLADMYIKQITEENSVLQDLIKKRQDALSKKKA